MPRKKRHGKPAAGASSKHAKHAKNAGAGPPAKGSKKVSKEETQTQNLQQLQEMFEGRLDAVLVHMIMEDCNYNVEMALETLFKLAGDVPNHDGFNLNPHMEKPGELVSYSESDTDETEELDDFSSVQYPPGNVGPSETAAGSGAGIKPPVVSSSNGVGLDDISLPHHKIKGLDYAITMVKQLDRNTFSEESVQKVTAGLMAYRDTGDRNKLKELGHLSAIAEMVLEVGIKEEEKEKASQPEVKFKPLHSRLPVYSATDDRLVGGMSSGSSGSLSSSPSHSDDETNHPDGSVPAVGGKSISESKEAGNPSVEPSNPEASALPQRTAQTKSSEKAPENLSLNNGEVERPLSGTNPNLSNTTINHATGSTTENRKEETATVRPKATVTFWNNLTTEQAETDEESDEDSEKDLDKDITFHEDSESFKDRLEKNSGQNMVSDGRSNLLKSQQLTKANNSTERSNKVYAPEREQMDNTISTGRPLRQPGERFYGNEMEKSAMNMPQVSLTRPQPGDKSQGPVQLENNHFFPVYSPQNASTTRNLLGKTAPQPFAYNAGFMPGYGMGTTHLFVKNVTPGLLPRTYHRDSQPAQKSSQPWSNQGYSRAFFAEVPPGTRISTRPYPQSHITNVLGFQIPHPRSPTVPRSNVTITEVPESLDEPITMTNTEEVSSGPQRWPLIQHTNLKRNEYPPAPSPRNIPPLPSGKVLCLMRGCPGSGKSTLAQSLKGDGVVLSTDDFFMVNGQYMYDRNQIGEAHDWNHKRAEECLKKGTSPIIIDNTNIMTWEMKPYVAMALEHHYQVVIREADTPWKHKAGELAKRNSHGVPKVAIERMLLNYVPNVTLESIMNGPDKKKTAEYIDKLNQEGRDHPKEDDKSAGLSGHHGGRTRKGNGGSHQSNGPGDGHGMDRGWETVGKHRGGHDGGGRQNGHGRGSYSNQHRGGKSHQDSVPGNDSGMDEGWETVGKHRGGHDAGGLNHRGKDWNQQRAGRSGHKDLNQRNDLKGGSPRRYNNEHPTRSQTEGPKNYIGASGRTKPGPYSSPNRTQSPSHTTKRSPQNRGGRRDGPQHDDDGWVSSPKRGRGIGGSHSPSPSRGYENKRYQHDIQGGKQNLDQHPAPESQHNKPSDAAIRFLETDDSFPQDPMQKLMNDIGIASSVLGSSSVQERKSGKTDRNSELSRNDRSQEDRTAPVSNQQSQSESVMPHMRQDPVQEVISEKANASNTETLLQHTQLSGSDDQKQCGSSSSAASLLQDTASECEEKTYGMLLGENLQGNMDMSLDMQGKIGKSVDDSVRSKEDDSQHNDFDYRKDIVTGSDAMQFEDKKTTSDDSIKQMDTDQSTRLQEHFIANSAGAQNSESPHGKPKLDDGGRIDEELHISGHSKTSDVGSVESSHLVPEKGKDYFECIPRTKLKAISPQLKGEESRSPSQCQSRESSRAPTPSLKRTSRRLSGGKSSRRLAAVFTSPTSTTPSGSEGPDWSKYDPSRNIPKPTFPVSKEEPTAPEVDLCDKSTETSGRDFSFLQRIVSRTIEPGDLPEGYICRTAVATYLEKADKNSGNETGEEDGRDGSSAIPVSVKLHKGCMTEEGEEKMNLEDEKISMMQVCFPTSSTKDLKSLLDTCNGDVQMATNVLLDSLSQVGANSGEDRNTPKEEVPPNATGTLFTAPVSHVSGNKVLVAETFEAGSNHQVSDVENQKGSIQNLNKVNGSDYVNDLQTLEGTRMRTKVDQQTTIKPVGGSPDHLLTSQKPENDSVPSDAQKEQSDSRHDVMSKLASDTERFASELEQANQILSSSDFNSHTVQTPERAQSKPGDPISETHDTGERPMTSEGKGKADVQHIKDHGSHVQEVATEQQEQEEDTDSDEDCEEFTNNFYSGSSQVVKPKSSSCSAANTSVDELPPLESFIEDRQMLQLAAACRDLNDAGDSHSQPVGNTVAPLHQPSGGLPLTKDKSAPEHIRKEAVNPTLQTEDSAIPQTKSDLPVTTGAKEVVTSPQTDQLTSLPESVSQQEDKEDSKDMKDLPQSMKEDGSSGTSLCDPNSTMNDAHDNEIGDEHSALSPGQDPKENDQESRSSCPKPYPVARQPEDDDYAENLMRDAPDSEVTSVDELSDSDIPWKSGYGVIQPEADGEAAEVDPSEKFTDSGEGVYDYLGGMVLQMDAAFALQLQELFGQVGFHLIPDMLSADDLKVKIGYQVAKQLHTAWTKGLEERFQDQERQMEEMLQRDEELARKLQQEENLKKLAKSHRDKKPVKFVSPGSPKWNKKRQKEVEPGGAVTNGGQDGMRMEQILVGGGGLRDLGELGAVGGIGPGIGRYPPPVQRMEVPELAQIMAEEELRQEREKKGMWNSPSPVRANTIATKLKRDQLFEAFPDVDKKVLDDIFQANNYDLQSTMWEVNAVYREPAGPVKDVFSPEAVVEMEKRRESSPARTKKKGQSDGTDGQFQSTEQPDYDDYRAEATLHFNQRDECFKKAAKAYHSGQKELAVHYSQQGHLHTVKMKEANRRAAEAMIVQRKHETGENKLDLHNLHVEEALQALQEVLCERQHQARCGIPSPGQQRYLEVVTGRGRHSKGGVAKLKPAVAKFLEQRGYRYTDANAGCLRVYF